MTGPSAKSPKELIKGASRQRRPSRINLAGHLVERFQILEAELVAIEESEDSSGALAKADEVDAVQAEMDDPDNWLELVMEQQPWADWRRFKAAHPVTEGVSEDEYLGVSLDALVSEFLPVCVVEPNLDLEDWEGILSKAATGDLKVLGIEAVRLHEVALDIPKSLTASRVRQRSSDSYEPHAPGASATAGSTGGNRPSHTPTTTRTAKP